MTGQHIAIHCKQIFSKYGWSETLISDNGPCCVVEAFTNIMIEFGFNHLIHSPTYLHSNGLAEKFVQIVRNLFHKAEEEGKDIFICLMIYHKPHLSSCSQSLMQILQSTSARSDL